MRALLLTACGAHKIQEVGDNRQKVEFEIALPDPTKLLEANPEADISARKRTFEYVGDIPMFVERLT